MTRARDVVEVIGRALADEPDAVSVTEQDGRDGSRIELSTAAGDLGRMIGRQGRIAKAMRALLAASRTGGDHRLDIVD